MTISADRFAELAAAFGWPVDPSTVEVSHAFIVSASSSTGGAVQFLARNVADGILAYREQVLLQCAQRLDSMRAESETMRAKADAIVRSIDLVEAELAG